MAWRNQAEKARAAKAYSDMKTKLSGRVSELEVGCAAYRCSQHGVRVTPGRVQAQVSASSEQVSSLQHERSTLLARVEAFEGSPTMQERLEELEGKVRGAATP